MSKLLHDVHLRISVNPWAVRFTILNRLLLAGAFIPTGLVKISGRPFTLMSPETTVGRFFAVFFENQLWYQSVGWAQLIAGVLLLIPATAHFGAFIFLPIILNINFITIGIKFTGTPIITMMMLLSNLWLIAWAYPYWRNWFDSSLADDTAYRKLHKLEQLGILVGSCGAFVLLFAMRGFSFSVPDYIALTLLGIGGLLFCAGLIKQIKNHRKS
jgi:uncharacterized membrane protein YphA (DoxX/SURF4 family)